MEACSAVTPPRPLPPSSSRVCHTRVYGATASRSRPVHNAPRSSHAPGDRQHETCCMLRQLVTPHLPAHPNHPDISLCSSHIGAGTFYRPDAGGDHLALGSILIGATHRRTSCQPAGLVPSRTYSAMQSPPIQAVIDGGSNPEDLSDEPVSTVASQWRLMWWRFRKNRLAKAKQSCTGVVEQVRITQDMPG